METAEPGTVEDLLADAVDRGHQVTARLVTDWTSRGLLDHPAKRPLGRGRGSQAALYTPHQRELFLTLLDKKRDGAVRIKSLARIPIWLWLYYGDSYVPTRQASRALRTWLGDYSSSQQAASRAAHQQIQQIDHPAATPAARRALHRALTEVALKRRIVDRASLERAIRNVFEPAGAFGPIRRGAGPSSMPLTADAFVPLIEANLEGARALSRSQVDEDFLDRARDEYRKTWVHYNEILPQLRLPADDQHALMFAADTPERQIHDCANNFLTLIGFLLISDRRQQDISALS